MFDLEGFLKNKKSTTRIMKMIEHFEEDGWKIEYTTESSGQERIRINSEGKDMPNELLFNGQRYVKVNHYGWMVEGKFGMGCSYEHEDAIIKGKTAVEWNNELMK
jgi:hypothetical protein